LILFDNGRVGGGDGLGFDFPLVVTILEVVKESYEGRSDERRDLSWRQDWG